MLSLYNLKLHFTFNFFLLLPNRYDANVEKFMVDWLSLHRSLESELNSSEYSRLSSGLIKIIFSGRQLTPVESHCVQLPHFQFKYQVYAPHRVFSAQNKAEAMKKKIQKSWLPPLPFMSYLPSIFIYCFSQDSSLYH